MPDFKRDVSDNSIPPVSAVGGIFRLDTRGSEQKFVIFGYQVSSNTARERFSVNLENGDINVGNPGTTNDVVLNFTTSGNDGLITWDEGNDRFKFSDDLVLDKGVLFFNETTTPTAIANHGALYTTSDNELFFQDGAGANHLLHGDSFSTIWFHGTGTVEVTISAIDTFTLIDSFTVAVTEP